MKRGLGIFVLGVFLINLVVAVQCDLAVSLISQDPYPAVPGDYIKLVFQVEGVENPECGTISFELLEKYPLVFDPDYNAKIEIESGTFKKDFSSHWIVPYKVRVDKNALDGDNQIEVRYSANKIGTSVALSKNFEMNIGEVTADFEIFVKDYDVTTKTLTFEILNIAESDVEAVVIGIPKQDTIEVKGASRNIVGDLDSNEYTTAEFEATPSDGDLVLDVSYTDAAGIRRQGEETVSFDSSYFTGRNGDAKQTSIWTYLFWAVVIGVVVWWLVRRHRRKKRR